MAGEQPITLTPPRGRNGWDDPVTGPDWLAVEMLNLDPYGNRFGKKRHGATALTATTIANMVDAADGWTDSTINLTNGQLVSLNFGQGSSSSDVTSALWIVTPAYLYRIFNGTSAQYAPSALFVYVTTAADAVRMNMVALNGRGYVAGNSAINRTMAVFDPLNASPTRTAAGLKMPAAAPTMANTGAGSYAATLRYYRVAWAYQASGVTLLRSNLGASDDFTPSGTGTAARITQPSVPANENITHWEIHVSLDDATYYLLTTVAIGTTTYDDSAATDTYDDGDLSPLEGSNYPFPSCKFLLTAFNRLMGFGRWETTAGDSILTQDGQVYFSPAMGASAYLIEQTVRETVEETCRVSISENATGKDTAFCGPLYGSVYAFQDRGIYQIVPTGVARVPFRAVEITRQFGAVSNQSTFVGEDEVGRPAIYFLDPHDGPRRIGADGIEWLGLDVADEWRSFNQGATTLTAVAAYARDRKQILFAIARGSSNIPTSGLMLDVSSIVRDEQGRLRGGWHKWTGVLVGGGTGIDGVVSMCMSGPTTNANGKQYLHANVQGAPVTATTTVPPNLVHVPYTGLGVETGALGFQASFTTKAYDNGARNQRVSGVSVLADPITNGSVEVRIVGNTGQGAAVNKTADPSLTPVGSESLALRRAEDDIDLGQVWSFQLTIGEVTGILNAATTPAQHRIVNVYLTRAGQDRA